MRFILESFLIKPYVVFWGLHLMPIINSSSQELEQVYEWETLNIVDVTSDINGNLYVSDDQGTLSKFNKDGLLLLTYSGNTVSPIYSVDVSHTAKVFGFYRDLQSYLILDRNLSPLREAILNSSFIGYATETAFSADNNLWFFDQSDLSLKKVNLLNDKIITSIPLTLIFSDEIWDIKQIEEYQNRLYLYNSNEEVYVFDNLGNFIKKLNIKPDCNFWFEGENLVYLQGSIIFKFNLYDNEVRKMGTLQKTNPIIKVISTNNFIYLISKNKITAFR